MTKVILVIKGGMLQSVISDSDLQYVLVDLDNIEQGDEYPDACSMYEPDLIVDNIEEHLLMMNPANYPYESFEEILKSDHPLLKI